MRLFCLFWFFIPYYSFCQITKEWVHTYNGSGDFNDRFTTTTFSPNGSIIAAGSTTNSGSDRDFLVCSFQPNGTLNWSWQFNGLGSGTDEVTSVVTDGQNNIYVTGFTKGDNTSTDYLTVKLNAQGDTLWTRSYDFVNEYDQANDIAIDLQGNVYITGQSDSDLSGIINDDYLTIKYDPNGNLLWSKRFNGIGNATDRSAAIVIDSFGDIYITGRSNNGTDDDIVTIKYNAVGQQIWIKYDDRGGWDRGTAIAIDPLNNIFVTGKSQNANNYDFWTLKYTSNGNLSFQQAFDFVDDDNPTAIAVDASGNCFVTGTSDADPSPNQNLDFQTVAYNTNGQLLWQKRFNGVSNLDDTPSSLAVSSNGVVVCGTSANLIGATTNKNVITITYQTSNGTQLWQNTYAGNPDLNDEGTFCAANQTGFTVIGYSEDANSNRNALILSFQTNGTISWSYLFDGIGDNNDNIRALAIDANGYIHVAGYSVQKGANRNLFYMNVAPNGQFNCAQNLDGNAVGSNDDAQGIVIDQNGNAIVAGFLRNKSTSNDIEITRINPGFCDTIWTKTIDGSGHGSDKVYDLTKDNLGFFYITGRQDVDPSGLANDNAYTAKFDVNGNLIWQKQYNSSGTNEDRGVHIRVSAIGNIFVFGRSWNGTNNDVFLIKYDSNGNQQWVRTFDGGANDEPNDFKLDQAENSYLLATSESGNPGVNNMLILKYNATGVLEWNSQFDGGGDDQAVAIALNQVGNIVVTGHTDANSDSLLVNYNIICVCFDNTGVQQWSFSYDGASQADDFGDDIEIADFGNIYLTGHTNKMSVNSPNFDVITFILDPNGQELWQDVHNGISDSSDVPNLILLNGNDFYIAGSSIESNQMRNTMIIKYTGTVGVAEQQYTRENTPYPNPFNNELNFHLDNIPDNSVFELFDLTAKPIYAQKINPTGKIEFKNLLTNGIYIYRISNKGSILEMGKVQFIND